MRVLTLARDLKRRKSREKHSLFVAEGVRSVQELTASTLEIVGVLVAPQLADAPRGVRLRQTLEERHVDVTTVNEIEFRSAAETESPQGVLAIAKIPDYSLSEIAARDPLRILVLDAVQDPGNVGTILRTAAALSIDAIVALPGTVDVWNAKVVRAAMGASFRTPVLQCATDELFEFLDTHRIELWAAEMDGVSVDSVDAPEKLELAVGNEGAGLSSNVRAKSSRLISLPISSAVESLNVSVATGILLYQLRKE